MHGQWDWMRDPKIHSTTWEWDHACASEGWKKSHNYEHHTFTNVLGKDRDLGYSIMRDLGRPGVAPGPPAAAGVQPAAVAFFEWGVAFYDLELELVSRTASQVQGGVQGASEALWRKARRQLAKDFVLYPALSGPRASWRAPPRAWWPTPCATSGRTP